MERDRPEAVPRNRLSSRNGGRARGPAGCLQEVVRPCSQQAFCRLLEDVFRLCLADR